jgi:hypothetical protein
MHREESVVCGKCQGKGWVWSANQRVRCPVCGKACSVSMVVPPPVTAEECVQSDNVRVSTVCYCPYCARETKVTTTVTEVPEQVPCPVCGATGAIEQQSA